MNKSPREQMLMMAFPAFAVIAIYLYWFHFPAQTDIDKVGKEVSSLRGQGDLSVLQQKTARVIQLRKDRTILEHRRQELDREWQAMTGSNNDPAQQQQRTENLVALLLKHNLRVVEQAPDGSRSLPKILDEVGKRLSGSRGQLPRVWTFRIEGSYVNLRKALRELAEGDPLVIPLGLSMLEPELGTTRREWTLQVWI